MATKSVTLTNSFQLITSAQAFIDLKGRVDVEYFTTAGTETTPADANATIVTHESFGYPGGDSLHMRVTDPDKTGAIIAVDEVA